MKVLKTIVATAVIVFALTTVAMAGVQHLNGRDDAPGTDRQAQKAKVTYTLRLTDRQMDRLAAALAKDHVAKAKHAAKHTAKHDRTATHAPRHENERHQETARHTQPAVSAGSGSSGTHHAEPAYTGTHHSSGSASGGTSTGGTTGGSGHHDGGHSGGHD